MHETKGIIIKSYINLLRSLSMMQVYSMAVQLQKENINISENISQNNLV